MPYMEVKYTKYCFILFGINTCKSIKNDGDIKHSILSISYLWQWVEERDFMEFSADLNSVINTFFLEVDVYTVLFEIGVMTS